MSILLWGGLLSLLGLVLAGLSLGEGSPESVLILPGIMHAIVSVLFFAWIRFQSRPSPSLSIFGAFELLRGTVVPLLVILVGQDVPESRILGSLNSSSDVLWIGFYFYVSVVVASSLLVRGAGGGGEWSKRIDISVNTTWFLIALGSVGMVLRFPSIDVLLGFLTVDDFRLVESGNGESGGGILGLSASLLRPLLPLGMGLLLTIREARTGRRPWLLWGAWLVLSYLALGSYGLNRATLLVPTVALILCYSSYFRIRLGVFKISFISLAGVFAFLGLGTFRASAFDSASSPRATSGWVDSMVQTVLVYGQSPLQSATVLDAGSWPGSTIISSIMSPIPGIGESWRESTGTAVYNRIIYGHNLSRDQILPSWLELYLGHGFIAVIGFGLVVAALLWLADRWWSSSSSLLEMYASILLLAFLAQISISSINAILQSLIYIVLAPSVLAVLVRRRRLSLSSPGLLT